VGFALSPFVIAPLHTAPFRILSLIDITSFVPTSLDPTPLFLPLLLKIAPLGQGLPEHGIQLHAILG